MQDGVASEWKHEKLRKHARINYNAIIINNGIKAWRANDWKSARKAFEETQLREFALERRAEEGASLPARFYYQHWPHTFRPV